MMIIINIVTIIEIYAIAASAAAAATHLAFTCGFNWIESNRLMEICKMDVPNPKKNRIGTSLNFISIAISTALDTHYKYIESIYGACVVLRRRTC